MAPAGLSRNAVATHINGKPLGAQQLRLIVPGDAKGGRSVRDVTRIEVSVAGSHHGVGP